MITCEYTRKKRTSALGEGGGWGKDVWGQGFGRGVRQVRERGDVSPAAAARGKGPLGRSSDGADPPWGMARPGGRARRGDPAPIRDSLGGCSSRTEETKAPPVPIAGFRTARRRTPDPNPSSIMVFEKWSDSCTESDAASGVLRRAPVCNFCRPL